MKTVVIFHLWHGPSYTDFTDESNIWTYRHYEEYFDNIHVVNLLGNRCIHKYGKLNFQSLGSGSSKFDILLAPFKLFFFVKKHKANVLVTYEQVWLWWIASFVRFFTIKPIYLNPLTIPEVIYNVTGKSLSNKLPRWFEKILITLSYKTTTHVITPSSYGPSVIKWLQNNKVLAPKLVVTPKIPESLSTPLFFEMAKKQKTRVDDSQRFSLLYVGRLHKEKMVDHLIHALAILKRRRDVFYLRIIGTGEEFYPLKKLAGELEVDDRIEFLSFISNGLLPNYYHEADVFVSPLTGSSLREAALCGLPIVAYELDWIVDLLKDRENYLAVLPYNYQSFAEKIYEIYDNKTLRDKLATNIKSLAWHLWSEEGLQNSMSEVYRKHIANDN